MKDQILKGFVLASLATLAVFILFYFLKNPTKTTPPQVNTSEKNTFEKFKTDEEFKSFLNTSQKQTVSSDLAFTTNSALSKTAEIALPVVGGGAPSPERYSETNVQVAGIDEPDIVKTDGKEIYYSSPQLFYRTLIEKPLPADDNVQFAPVPPRFNGGTLSLKAFPPTNLKTDSKIDHSGNLLLSKNILMVFENNKIYGYDVKNPANPSLKWQIDLKDNVEIVSSRLYKNNVYLVAKKYLSGGVPCPIQILSNPIRCTDIYRPQVNFQADSVYTVVKLNSIDGNIEKTLSFVGSPNSSTVYMSENSLYTTYFYTGSYVAFFYDFINQNSELLPKDQVSKINKLNSYDLSDQSKTSELSYILENYKNSLNDDDRLKFENNLQNRLTDYLKAHQREMGKTGIVKIDLDSLDITAHSSVPGQPLNQFSLDEYQGNLRIATTIGDRQNSANDIYVLDNNLKTIGSVTDLGLTERIYSARFIEDKAYIVTFRQTDPFYVIDLTDPKNPNKAGELKIPGFSSYLHPITKDLILGVGMENSKVKLSLFDVSNSSNPNELDKYNLDDYWTEVSNNHHAFLLDQTHKIFFLPGGKGGYIFSYNNNKLNMVKATSGTGINRALYIDNYLYMISSDKITVLDETNWTEINSLNL